MTGVLKSWAFLFLLALVGVARGENLYLTPSGGGSRNGTSWANAFAGTGGIVWGGAAGQLGAGDTLWMAGGAYSSGFYAQGSGTAGARLSIKRATGNNAECTGSVGWQASFDSQVLITTTAPSICIFPAGVSHITMDGQVTNGIKVAWTHTNNWQFLICRGANLEFKYMELQGQGGARVARNTGISPEGQNLLFDHMNIHGMTDGVFANNALNVTFQYSSIWDNHGTPWGGHENVFWTTGCRNTVIRYNKFWDWSAVGVLFGGWDVSLNSDGFYVYGNLFLDSSGTGIEVDCAGGRCLSPNLYIFNNTFVNMSFLAIRNDGRASAGGSGAAGGRVFNNIFYNCAQFTSSPSSFWGLLIHDYNWYSHTFDQNEPNGVPGATTDPFVNVADKRFHIKSSISTTLPRNKGNALGQEFGLDRDGNQRGADGFWDMGAYEIVRDITSPPTNLRIAP